MIESIKKTIGSILYERTTSPFFGTLMSSWLLWNWRIVYLTLFISEDKIVQNKLDYIILNLADVQHCITYPLLSTVALLTIVPFITNGAYWLNLKFIKWRKDQKSKVEMQQLLTLEQSIDLREQISAQEIRFDKLLENKNLEIKQLQAIIETNKKDLEQKPQPKKDDKKNVVEDELADLAIRVKDHSNEKADYDKLIYYVQKGYKMSGDNAPSTNFIALMESYDIIKSTGLGVYSMTEIGKKFHRLMVK